MGAAKKLNPDYYPKFSSINGKHPLQQCLQDSYILYPARKRSKAKIGYFNYQLAKEMGLIPKNHPEEMNESLEQVVLDTFSILIINEYDVIHKKKFSKENVKEHKYMATRYLQLQHPDNIGLNSGDGRSIWNGSIKHNGKTWDVSSCGTGATMLSPATSKFKKFFETGDPNISYGCGYSELDEGLESAFFSEFFHINGLKTERVLAVLDHGEGIATTVRAHPNLLRPSHMFLHLKQGNHDELKGLVNYYIDRQEHNGEWQKVPKKQKQRYQYFLSKLCSTFAELAADFEDNYIFCWMDWDGDNILMDGGIIDYGSVRQFGMFHYEYRYDDDDRFSTNIIEQKQKAKYTVQSFAQLIDFLVTGKKKNIKKFQKHEILKDFDKIFKSRKLENLLYKLGYEKSQSKYLITNHSKTVKHLLKSFQYFERTKSKRGKYKINDGITWDAVFCMRDILRELPQMYQARMSAISANEFIDILKSNYAKPKDLGLSPYRRKKISEFQDSYFKLLNFAARKFKIKKEKLLLNLSIRSSVINKYDRVTGDSISEIVHDVIENKMHNKSDKLYAFLKEFLEYQNFNPNHKAVISTEPKKEVKRFLEIVRELREGI